MQDLSRSLSMSLVLTLRHDASVPQHLAHGTTSPSLSTHPTPTSPSSVRHRASRTRHRDINDRVSRSAPHCLAPLQYCLRSRCHGPLLSRCLVSSSYIIVLSRLAVSSCLAAPHKVVTVSLVAASSDCAVTAVLLSCLAVVIVSISFLDIFLLELLVVSCSACLSLCCLLLPLGLLSLLDLPLLTPLLCCFPSCVPRPYLFVCLLELYLTVDGLLRMLLQFSRPSSSM